MLLVNGIHLAFKNNNNFHKRYYQDWPQMSCINIFRELHPKISAKRDELFQV